MAYSTINKQTSYFNSVLYTGNNTAIGSGGNAITGVGFQPDLVWIKRRASDAAHHAWYDAVRGTTKQLGSSETAAETTQSEGLTTLGTDGFTVGSLGRVNEAGGDTYVSWNWKAGTGQGSSNTDGSINTTYTSVNTTSGFSISKYTGTGSAATVGHGLGVAPKMIIVKRLNNADGWQVYVDGLSSVNHYLRLDNNSAEASDSSRFGAAPTASVFSIGTANGTNASGDTYIAYCFADKTGFSKIGSYSSNNNVNGHFVYTGFKPNWILIKSIGSGGYNWQIHDTVRQPSNLNGVTLQADTNATEFDYAPNGYVDLLSNGFKLRSTSNGVNGSGASTYLYMAFGQTLVGSNNVAATAR